MNKRLYFAIRTFSIVLISILFLNSCKKPVEPESIYVGTWVGNGKGCFDYIEISKGSNGKYYVKGNDSDCHPGDRFEGEFKLRFNHFFIGKYKFKIVTKPKVIDEFTYTDSGYSVSVSFQTNTYMEIQKPRFYEHNYVVKMYKML